MILLYKRFLVYDIKSGSLVSEPFATASDANHYDSPSFSSRLTKFIGNGRLFASPFAWEWARAETAALREKSDFSSRKRRKNMTITPFAT